MILISGMILGFGTGFAIAKMLVKVLTGVFDPPPQSLTIPWAYLMLLVALVAAVSVLVVSGVGRWVARAGPGELRDL